MKKLIIGALLFSVHSVAYAETILDSVSNLEALGTVPICAEQTPSPCANPTFADLKPEDLSPEKKKLVLIYEHQKLVKQMCYDSKGKFRPVGSNRSEDNKTKNFWVPFTCPGQEVDMSYTVKDYLKAAEPLSEKLRLAKSRIAQVKAKELDELIEAELESFCYQKIKSNSTPKSCDYSALVFPSPSIAGGKVASKFDSLDGLINSDLDCDKKVKEVQAWAYKFRAGDLDEQVLFEVIKNNPQEVLNNPQFIKTLKTVNLRNVPGATKGISGDNDGRLIISTYSNSLISVQNEVLSSMNVSNSHDFHKMNPNEQRRALDRIVPRYLELLKNPKEAETVARSFAKECDAKASRQLVGDEATCTVSGYAFAQNTHEYTNVAAYDSGPDGRFHCYPDKTFKKAQPTEGVYAPKGFSAAKLGYGSSCNMGLSFSGLCAKAKAKADNGLYEEALELCNSPERNKYSGARTVSSFCGENQDSPVCKAAREACQDSRILAYNSLGCYKKGITFNPSHIVGVESILSKKDGKTEIGKWGGCGSSHPGDDGAHSHNQLVIGNNTLLDPVNVFCRGDCF